MRKIVVAGAPGAGKTTLVRHLSAILSAPHAELDALFHGPNWTKRPDFEDDLDAFTRQSSWVTEWQYADITPLLLDRADTFIWLDLPLPLVLCRATRRTLRRWVVREELWAGNREQPVWKIFTDRSNIIRWSFASRHHVRDALPTIKRDHPDLHVIRLRHQRDVRCFLAALRRNVAPPSPQRKQCTFPSHSEDHRG